NASFESDIFYLKNDHIVLKDLGAPTIAVATSETPSFNYTRSQSGFEDVNTFYHLTNFANYITALGYSALQDFYIEVDPHGASGADQSFFTGGVIPTIQYGEGGVDDAEDADVIIHEYAHALSHQASPGSNTGFERRAADEGYGDYLAASYSRQFSDYMWGNVFNWDGHNEFWSGRQVNTTKVYPTDVVNPDIYKTGEIWSSALMDIYNILGAEVTDKLVFESLYGSFANMGLQDAAMLILNAENTIYGGMYNTVLYETLNARGLINAVPATYSAQPDGIQIMNTAGYTHDKTPLLIILPVAQNTIIQIYNIQGQLLMEEAIHGTDTIYFTPDLPTPGIYLLKVNGDLNGVKVQMIYSV
ncbi:MAG: T9SS type A sorting domain-containing protein, partial [Chitinophagales bacterium]